MTDGRDVRAASLRGDESQLTGIVATGRIDEKTAASLVCRLAAARRWSLLGAGWRSGVPLA
ncbi:MAG TPA: hypothetical protein VGZ22_15645 [Isosphaeraceae bacterium]|nr:hypothetical protein [Isosphaeraceae bacterium]